MNFIKRTKNKKHNSKGWMSFFKQEKSCRFVKKYICGIECFVQEKI